MARVVADRRIPGGLAAAAVVGWLAERGWTASCDGGAGDADRQCGDLPVRRGLAGDTVGGSTSPAAGLYHSSRRRGKLAIAIILLPAAGSF